MSWQEYSLGLIDALALPGVVLILGILFFRPLRAVSRRVQDDLAAGKALHIGAGGVHVGITERDDYHAQWYKPYQLRLATTERVTPETTAEQPEPGRAGAAPQRDDAEPRSEQATPEATPPAAHPSASRRVPRGPTTQARDTTRHA